MDTKNIMYIASFSNAHEQFKDHSNKHNMPDSRLPSSPSPPFPISLQSICDPVTAKPSNYRKYPAPHHPPTSNLSPPDHATSYTQHPSTQIKTARFDI